MPFDPRIEKLLQRCLQPADTQILHGQSLLRYVESPFGFWCDHNAPPEERESLDGFHDMLFQRGDEHEAQVVEVEWPDAESVGYTTDEEGFEAALASMFAGTTALAGVPLIHAPSGMGGRVDMLIRVHEASSAFGPFHYQVAEIKSAKNLTKGHLMQAAFYTRLLGEIQDHTPNEFHLVNGDGDVTSYPFADHESELDQIIEEARAVRDGSRPRPRHGSTPWPWSEYGDRLAVETRDVSLLASVGPSLQENLVDAGYETVDQVASATEGDLVRVRGVGASTANRLITKAQAIAGGRPVRRDGSLTIPEGEIEGFLDLEGTDPRAEAEGLSVTNYLIGIVTRIDGEVEYLPFFAESPEDEGGNPRAFLQWLSENPGIKLHHCCHVPYHAPKSVGTW